MRVALSGGRRAASWGAERDVRPSRGLSLSCVADGGGWERGAQVQASGREVRGPSRHVNVECIHGTVVIGEPKGLNQARQDVKQGDPVIALYVQGVERTGASADSCRRRTCVVPAAPVFAVGAPTRPSRARGDLGWKVAHAPARKVPARTFRPETFRPKPSARPWSRSPTTSCAPRLTGRRPPRRGRQRHDPEPGRRAGATARGARCRRCTFPGPLAPTLRHPARPTPQLTPHPARPDPSGRIWRPRRPVHPWTPRLRPVSGAVPGSSSTG